MSCYIMCFVQIGRFSQNNGCYREECDGPLNKLVNKETMISDGGIMLLLLSNKNY